MALPPSAKHNAGTPCDDSVGQARRPVALALGLRALTDRAVPARGTHDLGAFAESLQSAALIIPTPPPRAVVALFCVWGAPTASFGTTQDLQPPTEVVPSSRGCSLRHRAINSLTRLI